MTKANRVHSTPPTNTSVTRRNILSTIAAGGAIAALAISSSRATPGEDPIYVAIERHTDLRKAYDAAWQERAAFKDFGEMTEDEKEQLRQFNDATDAAGLPLEAAALDLIDTVPTTQAGIISAIFYMRIQHRNEGEHMIQGWLEDEDGERYIDWCDAWLETLTQAVLHLDNAAVQS
jgi:hypothetical protein